MLARGLQLDRLDHRDLLDISYALLLEPAAHDPEARRKAIEELALPLPGTAEARRKTTTDALATMGLTPEAVKKAMTARKAKAESAETADA